MGRNLPGHPALPEPPGWRRTVAVPHALESMPPTDTLGMLLFPKSPHRCGPTTERDFSTTDGQRLGADGKAPALWKPNEPAVVSPRPRPALCHPHPLAERRADGGPVAALAAEEATALSAPAGGVGAQLAPAPACGHKAKTRALRVTAVVPFFSSFYPRWGVSSSPSVALPRLGQPKPKNDPQKRRPLLNPSKSRRRNRWLCTQVSP